MFLRCNSFSTIHVCAFLIVTFVKISVGVLSCYIVSVVVLFMNKSMCVTTKSNWCRPRVQVSVTVITITIIFYEYESTCRVLGGWGYNRNTTFTYIVNQHLSCQNSIKHDTTTQSVLYTVNKHKHIVMIKCCVFLCIVVLSSCTHSQYFDSCSKNCIF